MARHLPSLNALKAFEAAARHGSFTDAAGELFVTHAAISRHIRELEDYVGVQLFIRTGRGVKLSEPGRQFSAKLTPLFDGLADAAREAAAFATVRRLNVSVDPSIASRWLVPRLGRFSELHPDIELNIDPSEQLVDFRAADVDLGIRYGSGTWPDVEMLKLSAISIFPVCEPKLIADRTILTPADLKNFTLLHESRKQFWADWLAENGVMLEPDWRSIMFQNHLAIEAAENGQGFALGDQIRCTDALIEGWLTRPFTSSLQDRSGYWIVRAKGSKENGPVRSFREWLQSEMAETNKRFSTMRSANKAPKS